MRPLVRKAKAKVEHFLIVIWFKRKKECIKDKVVDKCFSAFFAKPISIAFSGENNHKSLLKRHLEGRLHLPQNLPANQSSS